MTPEELAQLATAERQATEQFAHRINVCTATACQAAGSDEIKAALAEEVKSRGLAARCLVKSVGCPGLCAAAPLVSVEPGGALYQHVAPADAADIAAVGGRRAGRAPPARTDIPFFAAPAAGRPGERGPDRPGADRGLPGRRRLPRRCSRRSSDLTPQQAIDEIVRSGLRGRGGAGYPTGLKWRTVAKARGRREVRHLQRRRGRPRRVHGPQRAGERPASRARGHGDRRLRGRRQPGLPLRARRVPAGDPAPETTRSARPSELGVLGEQHRRHAASASDVDIRLGAGAFVCGEETALIASIEGGRGHAAAAAALPGRVGALGPPDADQQRRDLRQHRRRSSATAATGSPRIGTEKSKGTKVFALTGQVNNTGLIEVPMGITLREIVFEIGGGIPDGKRFKAVQTGGPSGGCIPERAPGHAGRLRVADAGSGRSWAPAA